MRKEISFKPTEWTKDIGNDENQWEKFVSDFYKEEWEKLSGEEKALCLAYRKTELKGKSSPMLTEKMSDIFDKYPDFHIGCLPLDKKEIVIHQFSPIQSKQEEIL